MRQKCIGQQRAKGNFSGKYDDWICLLCNNHNYSFRLVCNRCHRQTKQQNAYMNFIYEQQVLMAQQQRPPHLSFDHSPPDFPNVLFLIINDDPWEEQTQRREPVDTPNIKWINNLIED